MPDRMERFVLLPFTMGCITESSIAIGMHQAKRSKPDVNSTPTSPLLTPKHALSLIHTHAVAQTFFMQKQCQCWHSSFSLTFLCFLTAYFGFGYEGTREGEKGQEDYEEEYEYEESSSGENLKSPLSLLALPRFQKLLKNFKNFSQSLAYKDELEETEIGMDIGLPTDVKHVTHIGLDGCASSILSKGWKNLTEPELINFPSLSLTPIELAVEKHADASSIKRSFETKCTS